MTGIKSIMAGIAACCATLPLWAASGVTITVTNPLPQPRSEMVEVEASELPFSTGVLRDARGFEVPWQMTHDGKLIFPASVKPSESAKYVFEEGVPSAVDTIACASFHPERVDDIAWENDYAAYRAYGPAFGATGGRAYGFDVWTKSNSRPVVNERYVNELQRGKSYHIDHGDGMDVYDVGPSLGGGAAAPIGRDGRLIYPNCFSEWEILDNGPLRTTLRLKFEYGGGEEVRVITLDAGNPLNRTTVIYNGFDADSVAAGIVVHKPFEDANVLYDNYIAVADPTQKPNSGNGMIYIGIVNPAKEARSRFMPIETPAGQIVGHAVSMMPYISGTPLTYYWGSCWSKGRIMTLDQWESVLYDANRRLLNPLAISVETYPE